MIAFVHFHKCAGTTVVKAAEKSGMKLPDHRNGNPLHNNKAILWSNMSDEECESAFESFFKNNIEFIAFEHDMPPWHVLDKFTDLVFYSVIRDPQIRVFSNFRFSKRRSKRKNKPNRDLGNLAFHDFASSSRQRLWLSDNYYTRFICRLGRSDEVKQEHLDFAISRMKRFRKVSTLEFGSIKADLGELGFDASKVGWKKNSRKSELRLAKSAEDKQVDADAFTVSGDFVARNKFDFALYSYFLYNSLRSSL